MFAKKTFIVLDINDFRFDILDTQGSVICTISLLILGKLVRYLQCYGKMKFR